MARFGGLLPVAVVAAVVSYRHLSGLIHHYGEDDLTAIAGPAAVDGLMIMAAAALLASGAHRDQEPAVPATPVPATPVPTVPSAPEPLPASEVRPETRPEAPSRAVNGAIPSGVVR